jgi:phosphatidylinositol 3-kinase
VSAASAQTANEKTPVPPLYGHAKRVHARVLTHLFLQSLTHSATRTLFRLLARWKHIDPEDALLLLSPDFTVPAVREHAVDALRRASDDELLIYLLQLVQALRYEPSLVARAAAQATASSGLGAGRSAAAPIAAATSSQPSGSRQYRLSPLADFLIDRACVSLDLANFLQWYLTVELEDIHFGSVYSLIHSALFDELKATASGRDIASKIEAQADFVQQLVAAVQSVTSSKRDNVATKIEKLNACFSPGGAEAGLVHLSAPVCAPVNPAILLAGVHPRGCHIFKVCSACFRGVTAMTFSSLYLLRFSSEQGVPYSCDVLYSSCITRRLDTAAAICWSFIQ